MFIKNKKTEISPLKKTEKNVVPLWRWTSLTPENKTKSQKQQLKLDIALLTVLIQNK